MISKIFHKPLKPIKRGRKYPIKRDEYGRSARQRSFALFDQGMKPSEVALKVGITPRTAYRYYSDWKKQPRDIQQRCSLARGLLKSHSETSENNLKQLADILDISSIDLKDRLMKPWGIRSLVTGKIADSTQTKEKGRNLARLQTALDLVCTFEEFGIPPNRQSELIRQVAEAFVNEIGKLSGST